ncbi:transcriptional regulator, putative ATPase, winged helix family [Parafrankia sp. EAN1pec]|uniref:BTAD domain-containing putative transcriptional regulator n=1 Tax=Parafrankia sp. (strain EAN1pec) TaxID=298653 RepID=UPI0000542CF4|nr:transcriptional regulator, putative ATPase, winged helix family [Frankia sp. EAN1pec]
MSTTATPGAGTASSGGQLCLQILGPLRIWRGGVELEAGPRQQAYLLALLLARAGRPTSMSQLIDLIWGDDVPASAVNILQKYVGALRRLLEPTLPARATGSYLQRRGDSYLFAAGPVMLDVVTFRELVEVARAGVAEQRPDAALDWYAQALGLWHGPAGDGLAHGSSAMSVFSALDGEFLDACVAAAELAVARGRPARVLAPLRLAAGMAPLHETVQASLVIALAAAGQQAEALSVLRAVRARLAEELGIDPGPALVAAHRRVLEPAPAEGMPSEWLRVPLRVPALGTTSADGMIGRAEELAVLRRAVDSAFAGGAGLVVVEGEPGVGKTRLLEEAGAEADGHGALVVWGRCLEGDGTPAMWPWEQAVGLLLDNLPTAAREDWHAGELSRLVEPRGVTPAAPALQDKPVLSAKSVLSARPALSDTPVLSDSGTRFRLFERAVALISHISVGRPVVIVVDDLQWADVASLQMFSHLAARLPVSAVIIGAIRDRLPAAGSELARMLAAASRQPRHRRIRLGPLNPAEAAELVRRDTGQIPSPGVARSIHARTAGNPFLIRELARHLADSGDLTDAAAAQAGVPSTVRDVVRDRMAGLDNDATDLLQIAALIGRDVDLALLAHASELDVQTCIDHLEPLEALGLLVPRPGKPFSYRFVHDLVRESVADTTPLRRLARLHLLVPDALERMNDTAQCLEFNVDGERKAQTWNASPMPHASIDHRGQKK